MKIEDKKVWNQQVLHKLYLMPSVFMILKRSCILSAFTWASGKKPCLVIPTLNSA